MLSLKVQTRGVSSQEQGIATMSGIKWSDRGPLGDGRTAFWRGQPLRMGTQGGKVRYAKRGGKQQEKYRLLAQQGLLRPTKGKGKGKNPEL